MARRVDFEDPTNRFAVLLTVVGVWLVFCFLDVVREDHVAFQRKGTILVAIAVVAFGISQSWLVRQVDLMKAWDQIVDREVLELLRGNGDIPKELVPEEQRLAVLKLADRIDRLGGADSVDRKFRWVFISAEIVLIVVGTLQSGYGDLVSARINALLTWQ